MGARFLLIDGYNLLHAAGLALTQYRPGELRRRRERLLRQVAGMLTAAETARGTVIFDARDPTVDRPHRTTFVGLQIIYARPEGDADVVIGKWLNAHPSPRHVTLVSSDRELQRAARRIGARFVESRSFLDELFRRQRKRDGNDDSDDTKPFEGLTSEEAEAWTGFFGDLEAGRLEAEVERDRFGECDPIARNPSDAPMAGGASSPTTNAGRKDGVSNPRRGKSSRRRQKTTREEKPATDDELEFWLREFGELPELQELGDRPEMSVDEIERWLREFDAESD